MWTHQDKVLKVLVVLTALAAVLQFFAVLKTPTVTPFLAVVTLIAAFLPAPKAAPPAK